MGTAETVKTNFCTDGKFETGVTVVFVGKITQFQRSFHISGIQLLSFKDSFIRLSKYDTAGTSVQHHTLVFEINIVRSDADTCTEAEVRFLDREVVT
ncbi:hypothetical protein D3C86_1043610 [compost metagenome]